MPGPGSWIHWVGASKARSRVGSFYFYFFYLEGGCAFSFGGGEEEGQHSRWKNLVGEHMKWAFFDHEGCEMHHEWIRLQMEVAEHFVGAPAAD